MVAEVSADLEFEDAIRNLANHRRDTCKCIPDIISHVAKLPIKNINSHGFYSSV